MFERCNEEARRVLFFARDEASRLGSLSIATEHVLLGLIRDGKGMVHHTFVRSKRMPSSCDHHCPIRAVASISTRIRGSTSWAKTVVLAGRAG
jgi:Clp amino terminal domain, pathogenicity island component